MIPSQAVVVAHCAAGFWPVLVVVENVVGQVGKLTEVLLDVQDVRVEVQVLIAIRVGLEQLLEVVNSYKVLLGLVACMGYLIFQVK